jgi:hypothetical protein
MIADRPQGRPALLPALAAMTWLQALVALALFAPGAVAPTANLSIPSLSIFSTAVFAVGVLTTSWAGGLIARIGSLRMASLCAAAVAGAVLTTSYAGLLVTPLLISVVESFAGLAGAFVGLAIPAFGGTAARIWGDAR